MSFNDEFDYLRMTPVICVAEIPLETINLLLTRIAEQYQNEDDDATHDQLYLMTTRTPPTAPIPSPTKAPIQHPFTSPFLGLSPDQLREKFKSLFWDPYPDPGPFTQCTFIVLDARSAEDETCLVVSNSMLKGEARTDFWIPNEVLGGPEMGSHELNEGEVEEEWRDPGSQEGGFLYTREKWMKRREEFLRGVEEMRERVRDERE